MKPRLPITPKSMIKNVLRRLWMWSRERRECIKLQENTCQKCGIKGSARRGEEVKIEVNHKKGVNWDRINQVIYEELLVEAEHLECLCKECHKLHTYGEKDAPTA